MANRVVISPSLGIRVSKAGFNVLTTSVDNLLISDQSSAFNLYLSGSTTVASGATVDVNFGETLSGRPLAFAYYSISGLFYSCQYLQNISGNTEPEIAYRVYTTKISFINKLSPASSLTVYYKVWQIYF